jgi:hypothetical protein
MAKEVQNLFETRDYLEIEKRFAAISPLTVVAINFDIAKKIESFKDEGISLSKTLLPYLSKCSNYDFITQENNALAARLAQTLAQFFQDSELKITKGFASYCLEFYPQAIHKIIISDDNQQAVSLALKEQGYNKYCCDVMSHNPTKLLWPETLNILK